MNVLQKTDNWEHLRFRSHGSTVNVIKSKLDNTRISIDKRKPKRNPRTGPPQIETLQSTYNRTKANVIINGGLYAMNTGRATGVLRSDEQNYGDLGFYYAGYVMSILEGNKLDIEKLNSFYDLDKYGSGEAIECTPTLLINNKISINSKGLDRWFITSRNPRSAFGFDNEHAYTITVDGRRSDEAGVTINELVNIVKALGCTNAFNLDGGFSTRMMLNGAVVNRPMQNRAVNNTICMYFEGENEEITHTPVLVGLLRRGSRGENVRILQERLNALGHGAGTADGIFGPMTDRAVRSFQRSKGLLVDGIVGPMTWPKLF